MARPKKYIVSLSDDEVKSIEGYHQKERYLQDITVQMPDLIGSGHRTWEDSKLMSNAKGPMVSVKLLSQISRVFMGNKGLRLPSPSSGM